MYDQLKCPTDHDKNNSNINSTTNTEIKKFNITAGYSPKKVGTTSCQHYKYIPKKTRNEMK